MGKLRVLCIVNHNLLIQNNDDVQVPYFIILYPVL